MTIAQQVLPSARAKGITPYSRIRYSPKNYAVDGKEGADAERYDEKNLAEALRNLEIAKRLP